MGSPLELDLYRDSCLPKTSLHPPNCGDRHSEAAERTGCDSGAAGGQLVSRAQNMPRENMRDGESETLDPSVPKASLLPLEVLVV